MQQQAHSDLHQWLPEINPCKIELEGSSAEKFFRQEINKIIEEIQAWATSILEKANLPSTSHEAKELLGKYDTSSNEGCALRAVIELDALQASIRITDANTAAITGMKLFETIWKRELVKINQPNQRPSKQNNDLLANQEESEANIELYQETINELKRKYPHCNVNALRLLASTRLNVTKQQLDDLNITPQ